MPPLCDTRRGERGTGVCGPRAHPITACAGDADKESPTPWSAHIWWILMVRTVDSGRKQRAGLQHKNAAEEKVSEEDKCWRVLAPHLWLWPAAEAPGEAELPVLPAWEMGLVLYILTLGQWSKWEMGWKQKKKREREKERKFGKSLLTRTQRSKQQCYSSLTSNFPRLCNLAIFRM